MTHKQDTAAVHSSSAQHLQSLFRRAVSFIDTPRKHWPIVAKLYRWVLAGGTLEHGHIAEYNLARNLQEQGKHEEACRKYEATVNIDPSYGRAYLYWGLSMHELKQDAEAKKLLEKAEQMKVAPPSGWPDWYKK